MLGKVEICGVNTSRLQTLSNEEMMRLIELAQKGDQAAKQRLVEGNLKLVLSVIQRFLGRGENPDDLFQVGCIGLLKAIANFDTTKDVRFSTYGVPMIAGELRRYLRDYSPIRVSRSVRDLAYRVLQCKQAMTAENGREPTFAQIAERLGVPEEDVVGAMDAVSTPVSLYEPVYTDGGDPLTVMDQVRDVEEHGRAVARIHCAAAGDAGSQRARAAHFGTAVLRRADADGGGRESRHFAGAGLAVGERGFGQYPEGDPRVIKPVCRA